MRDWIKVRSCKQYMFYGTHMVLEKFEVHFSINWPFNNRQCHDSIHSKKCSCQKTSSMDKALFHCGVASFFGMSICLSGSLVVVWCLIKEANLFRLILADMSNVVIPSLLILLWGNVLELVFAGPVHWTEKRPKSNWTQLQKTRPPVAVAQILKFFSCQLQGLLKNWKSIKTQSFVPSCVGPYSHIYLPNCQSLNHKKQSRIGWDMAKNIFIHNLNVCPFCFRHISAKS